MRNRRIRALRPRACGRVVALLAVAACAASAQAQDVQRVLILGSIVDAASPAVSVIPAAELVRAGVHTAEQALRRIAANQPDKGLSQAVGELTGGMAEADLRGLGPSKTLVLLNGRRLSNHAYDGAAVDLNSIPMSAVERIEVLREGASALYGSGAMAGVVNFILRRELQGVELGLYAEQPEHGGGRSAGLSFTAGYGDLAAGGLNVWTTLDLRRQQAIAAQERSFSRSGVLRAADGSVLQSRTGSTSFPGDLDGFEPSLAAGCAPPRSIPDAAGGSCRYDFMRDLDLVPQNDQSTWLTQATFAVAPGQRVGLDYLRAQNQTQSRQGPAPLEQFLPQSSPFWIAGRPARPVDDLGDGGITDWLSAPAGQRVGSSSSLAQRLLLIAQRSVAGFDTSATLGWARSEVSDSLGSGHVDLARIQRGLVDGHINPFGEQTAPGLAAFRDAALSGRLVDARGDVGWLELHAATRLTPLDGGPLMLLLGLELRRERFSFELQPLAQQTADPGFDLAVSTQGSRRGSALFAQLLAPMSPTFGAELAARIDRFDDAGDIGSGKLVANWRPDPQLLLRASLGNNFRVPALYETWLPQQLDDSGESFDDPRYCPGGVPLPGVPAGRVCAQQVLQRTGGPVALGAPPSSLRAERSRNLSLGLAWQPSATVRLGLDYWGIELSRQIDTLPLATVFADPVRHAGRIVRCSQLDPAAQAEIDRCLDSAGLDAIAYVDTPLENLGNVRAQGVDLSLALDSGATPYGRFSFSAEGTYVLRYDVQSERGGTYTGSVGRFAVDAPIFRWQHVAQAVWTAGPWTATLSQRYLSGYLDQEPSRKVDAYSLLDASLAYAVTKNLVLSIGVKNLLDRAPPASNQSETPQANYDPRFTDPAGRSGWLRLSASFD